MSFTSSDGRVRERVPWLVYFALPCWIVAIGFGFWRMQAYNLESGEVGPLPDAPLVRDTLLSERPCHHLFLFLHADCPCSRASLLELAFILERGKSPVVATVVFVVPSSAPSEEEPSSLEQLARTIPGVVVQKDPEGRMAEQVGARTSGHTLLVDATGTPLFHGGITGSRGDEGDNPGRRSLLALLAGEKPAARATKVYGCPLRPNTDDEEEGVQP